MKNQKRGVTLVEIAIVLVIIGLLLGGVLKGQELINNAKVRSMADRQNSLKVAWFSFIDRFQALPGDYVRAEQNIPGAAAAADHTTAGDGFIEEDESAIVMQNLTGAGYLRCPQCTLNVHTPGSTPTANDSLQNQYGGVMAIYHDSETYAAFGGPGSPRLMVHTGPAIPSNIIAEVDRKLDDGVGNTGDFVFSTYKGASPTAPLVNMCLGDNDTAVATIDKAEPQNWRWATAQPPVEQNCGAVVTI